MPPNLATLYKTAGKKLLNILVILPVLINGVPAEAGSLAVQVHLPHVVHNSADRLVPPTPNQATWSSPIAVSAFDGSIWTVNPDSDSLTVLQAHSPENTVEVATGQEPWSVTLRPDGDQVVVANRASGTLTFIDGATHTPLETVPVGAEPGAVVFTPNGQYLVVSLMTEAAVVFVDVETRAIVERILVAPVPYALAVAADSQTVYVTHLIAQPHGEKSEATDDGRQGSVSVIDVASSAIVDTVHLLPNPRGSPNRLTSITLIGHRAWLPHIRVAPALPNSLTTTLFAAVMGVDLENRQEDPAAFIPLNDEEIFGSPVNNPTMAVPSPDGKRLYVVLAGSDLVEVVDIADPHQPKLIKFVAVGRNPQGIALSSDGTQGYVMNYLARSITVLDLVELHATSHITTTQETLAPDILRGKVLFNSAVDPRLAQGSWISCASCHFEGWPDGATWFFPDGPRQTPPLWNAGATLPWHWSAALDEAQDVEDTIHVIQRGLGLGPGADPPLLGAPNAARSGDLDALAAFLLAGMRTPALSPTAAEGDDAAKGRALFISAGCNGCHAGPSWTLSSLPGPAGTLDLDGNGVIDIALHDVGTRNPADVRGEPGFDVPSLLGVGLTAPYFHDGSVLSLESLLATGHPTPAMPALVRNRQANQEADEHELASLIRFLQSIGLPSEPVDLE